MRRRSADRRDNYYRVDLARCGELLQAAGGASIAFYTKHLGFERDHRIVATARAHP